MSSAELFALIALATVGTFTSGPNHTAKRLQWFNRLMALALLATVVWMVHSSLPTT